MWFAIDTLEYLRRGGRIGGARRLDRLGAEDQADPHPRGGDHPGRAGPHPRPLDRAAARLRPPAPRVRPRRLGRPAHPGPRDGRGADRRLPRDLRLRAGLRLRDRRRARRPRRPRLCSAVGSPFSNSGSWQSSADALSAGGDSLMQADGDAQSRRKTGGADDRSSRRCSRTWRRQSVSSATRTRSGFDRVAEVAALRLDVAADLRRRSGRARRPSTGGRARDGRSSAPPR